MRTLPYQPHSETSFQAALDFAPVVDNLESRVLGFIKDSGPFGATDDELIQHFKTQSARPRRIALVDAGKVKDALKQRKTVAGRMATVWVLA